VSAARFAHETILILGMLALLFWLLALLSYSARDAAWSTSGAGGAVVAAEQCSVHVGGDQTDGHSASLLVNV